jgi:general secretion pathway protein G
MTTLPCPAPRTEAHDAPRAPRARRAAPRRRQRGLTLIEILVVVTILGIIASMVGIAVAGQLEEAKIDTARIQMGDLSKALDLYKVKFNKYPQSLSELTQPPEGRKPIIETVPQDPWNNDYVYVFPGQANPGKFDLQSKGPDGVTDTEDDVKSGKK